MTVAHDVDREDVMALVDGELSPERAHVIRAHVAGCVECRALAAELGGVSSAMAEWRVDEPPDRFQPARVRALASGAAAPASSRRRWFSVLTPVQWAVAASLVVVLGATLAVQWRQQADFSAGRQAAAAIEPVTVNGAPPQTKSRAFSQGQATTPETSDTARLIVRVVSLALSIERFDDAQPGIERLARAHRGSVTNLSFAANQPNRRSLSATIRVPVTETDAALAELRTMGAVLRESQSAEDVTDSHRDLEVRLANAKVEEKRLGELLARRTDKLADVLAVEQAQSRVRGEIEQMTAEENSMRGRAAQSTINVDVQERYRAELDGQELPFGRRLRNAVVDGVNNALDGAASVLLAVIEIAPTMALSGVVLFVPGLFIWRRVRKAR